MVSGMNRPETFRGVLQFSPSDNPGYSSSLKPLINVYIRYQLVVNWYVLGSIPAQR